MDNKELLQQITQRIFSEYAPTVKLTKAQMVLFERLLRTRVGMLEGAFYNDEVELWLKDITLYRRLSELGLATGYSNETGTRTLAVLPTAIKQIVKEEYDKAELISKAPELLKRNIQLEAQIETEAQLSSLLRDENEALKKRNIELEEANKIAVDTMHRVMETNEKLEQGLRKLYNAIDSCVELTPEMMQEISNLLNSTKNGK